MKWKNLNVNEVYRLQVLVRNLTENQKKVSHSFSFMISCKNDHHQESFLSKSQQFARDDAMRDALAVSYQLFQFMATVSRGSWFYFTGRRKTSLFSYFLAKILTTSSARRLGKRRQK